MPDREIPRGYILGFDFGLQRIGAAVGQARTCTATALGTLANGGQPDWTAISELVAEWSPEQMVVGVPLAEDGGETEMSEQARRFGRKLSARFDVPVAFCDERLTTREAGRVFSAARALGAARRKDAERIDAVAARIILENWLQSLPSEGHRTEDGKPST